MILAAMHRRAVIATSIAVAAGALVACGSQGNEVPQDGSPAGRGAQLFAERCSGCHTLDVVGAQGGASNVRDQERVDGPNFNVRKETVENVLYAIRNGGFSGAIMPENIVVGQDAQAVAEFLSEYAGK
jgi:mono/diheme cytochrome c family protein